MSEAAETSILPLSVPNVGGNELAYVTDCLDSGWLSAAGAYVGRFESAVCKLTGSKYAVACASGTAALHVALLVAGVVPGDSVIVPTVTFIASANAVRYCGAEPVLIDCDDRLGIDNELLREYLADSWNEASQKVIDSATGRPVTAIMPVHVFGDPCRMEELLTLAERYGLAVIEDATESLGSRYTVGALSGRATGTIGLAGAFSFNGNKIISTGGGGMLVTDDEEFAHKARYLFHQAKDDAVRYFHGAVGFNYAMSNVAAAIGLGQIERLPAYIETKRQNRARYAGALADVTGLSFLVAPDGTDPNCWFYTVLIEPEQFGMSHEEVMGRLAELDIQSRPLWLPIHMQKPYLDCTVIGSERATWYWERVLNLPCSSNLTFHDVDRVADAIKSFARS